MQMSVPTPKEQDLTVSFVDYQKIWIDSKLWINNLTWIAVDFKGSICADCNDGSLMDVSYV